MSQDCRDFETALAKGSGRAMLLLKQAADPEPFKPALVHACLRNLAYDPQCEHERSAYLARLVIETGDQHALFAGLAARIKEPDVNAYLLFCVLARLAAQGTEAEKSVVRQVYLNLSDEDQLDCMDALVRLDGLSALLKCAARLEGDLEEEGWRVGGLLGALRQHGEVDPELARAGHPVLDRLMARLDAEGAVEAGSGDQVYDFPAIRAQLRSGKRPAGAIVRTASDAEWRLIAEDFLLQDRDNLALQYLTLFSRRAFPGEPQPLVRWTTSPNARVSWAATRALGRIDSPVVRAMALEKIEAGETNGVRLLTSNYRPGDLDRISPMLRDRADDHAVHDLGLEILNLTGDNDVSVEDSHDILVSLYKRTPCSMCRGDVVSRLFKAGQVPAWMADECRFDADPDTATMFDAGPAG